MVIDKLETQARRFPLYSLRIPLQHSLAQSTVSLSCQRTTHKHLTASTAPLPSQPFPSPLNQSTGPYSSQLESQAPSKFPTQPHPPSLSNTLLKKPPRHLLPFSWLDLHLILPTPLKHLEWVPSTSYFISYLDWDPEYRPNGQELWGAKESKENMAAWFGECSILLMIL